MTAVSIGNHSRFSGDSGQCPLLGYRFLMCLKYATELSSVVDNSEVILQH